MFERVEKRRGNQRLNNGFIAAAEAVMMATFVSIAEVVKPIE